MSSKASRAAYKRCSETCQKVRAEISTAIEFQLEDNSIDLPSIVISRLTDAAFEAALAHGTEKLRAALVDCEDELMDTQKALETAEDHLEYARSQANDLREEVESLRSELDRVPSA